MENCHTLKCKEGCIYTSWVMENYHKLKCKAGCIYTSWVMDNYHTLKCKAGCIYTPEWWKIAIHWSVKQGQLLTWYFEPSQPQRITSGLKTNFTLSPDYSFHKSSYHKSCFLSLFVVRGHSTREPASGMVTYFILRAYTETGVSHSQHRKKNRKRFWKKCRWMDRKGRNMQGRNPWQ